MKNRRQGGKTWGGGGQGPGQAIVSVADIASTTLTSWGCGLEPRGGGCLWLTWVVRHPVGEGAAPPVGPIRALPHRRRRRLVERLVERRPCPAVRPPFASFGPFGVRAGLGLGVSRGGLGGDPVRRLRRPERRGLKHALRVHTLVAEMAKGRGKRGRCALVGKKPNPMLLAVILKTARRPTSRAPVWLTRTF